ncbi:MAG: DUF3014 domain-containing protein [Lentisphaerae bacterium]|nr:DUF3014 domain-containing protein [Lentisphaerota bacterium]
MDQPDSFQPDSAPASRSKALWWALPLVAVAAVALIVLRGRLPNEAPEPVPPPPLPPPAQAPAETLATPESSAPSTVDRYAIEAAPSDMQPAEPLPALDDSDAAITAALARLVDKTACERFLILSHGIRRAVATVDNLTSSTAPPSLWPVKPTGGRFLTTGAGDAIRTSADNARRYGPVLAFMESIDTAALIPLYVQYYPLFQEAYRELGYPEGDFNTRLVEVIDHLLATPDIADPVALTPHAVMFKYADASLEELSAGQKLLLRMGNANAQRVKAKLRDLRHQLTRESEQSRRGRSGFAR